MKIEGASRSRHKFGPRHSNNYPLIQVGTEEPRARSPRGYLFGRLCAENLGIYQRMVSPAAVLPEVFWRGVQFRSRARLNSTALKAQRHAADRRTKAARIGSEYMPRRYLLTGDVSPAATAEGLEVIRKRKIPRQQGSQLS